MRDPHFFHPIRDRFGLLITLDYYPEEDIAKIAGKSAEKLNMNLQPASAAEIAGRARGVPRIGNRLLRRVRDVSDEPSPRQVEETLLELGIDSWGLESADRALLLLIYRRFNGGPVGLKTLAGVFSIDEQTLADAFEPYLVRTGLLDITERGRRLTALGFAYCQQTLRRLGTAGN